MFDFRIVGVREGQMLGSALQADYFRGCRFVSLPGRHGEYWAVRHFRLAGPRYEGTAIIQSQQCWMPEVGFGFVEIDGPREEGIFPVFSTKVWPSAKKGPVAVTVIAVGDGDVAGAK